MSDICEDCRHYYYFKQLSCNIGCNIGCAETCARFDAIAPSELPPLPPLPPEPPEVGFIRAVRLVSNDAVCEGCKLHVMCMRLNNPLCDVILQAFDVMQEGR